MSDTTDDQTLLAEIRAYCAEADIKASTLGLNALGNSRFVERLERRVQKAGKDAEAVRQYMAANPPRSKAKAVGS